MKYILLITLLLNLGLILGCTVTGAVPMDTLSVPLEQTSWQLELLGTKPAIQKRKVTLVFQANNRLGGEAGCNSYGATYSLNGDQLILSEIVSTLMACVEPEIMEQEQQFLASLEQASSYKLEGNHLIILDTNGDTLLSFVRG
jgi:heat shock protein HslJ